MADRFVRTTGVDTNGGTSKTDAWLTIGKAMTSSTAGDVIYVGAGTYRVSSTIAPSSMASMTYLYGDTDGSHTGDAGEVVITNFATDDTTAPTNVTLFTFASKNYWTLGDRGRGRVAPVVHRAIHTDSERGPDSQAHVERYEWWRACLVG